MFGPYGQLGHSDLVRILKERDAEILQLQMRLADPNFIYKSGSGAETPRPLAVQESYTLNIANFKKWFNDLFTARP